MTAILGVIGFDDSPSVSDAVVRRMLGAMARRGASQAGVWRQGPAVLAVARQEWEFGPGFSGPVLAVEDGDCAVVADASLYYRDDLRRRLAAKGIRPAGQTPSHLILAAYRAWGDECPKQLEGDFAFVLYDRRARRVLAARDFVGSRPLFYAELGGSVVVASSINAILAHPACSAELNLAAIGTDAAGLSYAMTDETCYRDVRRLYAGFTLSRAHDASLRLRRHWEPQVAEPRRAPSFDDGAEELRALLCDAVAERLDPGGPTSVWLSGGWDSPAVFGAAQKALASRGESGDRLRTISVSHPQGDPGHEDDKIAAIGEMWKSPITWLRIQDIPMFDGIEQRACSREEPRPHEYEQLVRALVRGSSESHARVALHGNGGDFLFQVSPVFLADLLASGRLVALRREWQAMRLHGARTFFKWAVEPLLPPAALRLAAVARGGRPLRGYFEVVPPAWMDQEFMRSSGIAERAAAGTPRVERGSRAAYEMHWFLTQPHFSRASSFVAEFALDQGVEVRAPLYDNRLIAFAGTRPRSERHSGGEQKRLLRHAMRGLLPESVLARRPFKTGNLSGYFMRSVSTVAPALRRAADRSVLVELGVVDRARFRQAVDGYCRDMRLSWTGFQLLSTLHAELWLQSRLEKHDAPEAGSKEECSFSPSYCSDAVQGATAAMAVLASGNSPTIA